MSGHTTSITIPEFAEDGDEKLQLLKWNASEGQRVHEGDEIVELLTDKATFTIPAPVTGVLQSILVGEGAEVSAGCVLGEIVDD